MNEGKRTFRAFFHSAATLINDIQIDRYTERLLLGAAQIVLDIGFDI